MRLIYVDDEKLAIRRFELMIGEVVKERFGSITDCHSFSDVDDALAFVRSETVDLAFLDISMPKMDGLTLAKKIKQICPNASIVFITAYDDFALEAYKLDALGYLTKPFSTEGLKNEIQKAIKMYTPQEEQQIFIQTMPRFDVFVNGQVLVFPGKKAKELLALLVDRNGGEVTNDYAITYLWENRPYDEATKTLYRVLKKKLKDVLEEAGIGYILIDAKTKISVNKNTFQCDYYNLLEGDIDAIKYFDGKYMFEYGWAEETAEKIAKIIGE